MHVGMHVSGGVGCGLGLGGLGSGVVGHGARGAGGGAGQKEAGTTPYLRCMQL